MRSKERILNAFAFQENDRIPCYEQQISNRVASDILGRKALTGGAELYYEIWTRALAGDTNSLWERSCKDNVELYRRLGLDMIPFLPPGIFSSRPQKNDGNRFYFGGKFWEEIEYAPETQAIARRDSYLDQKGIEGLKEYVADQKSRKIDSAEIIRTGKLFRAMAPDDMAIAGFISICIPADEVIWLEATLLAPDLVGEYLDIRLRDTLETIGLYARDKIVDVVHFGGDLCGNTGPMYSPAIFRAMVVPRLKQATALAHQLGLKTVYNTDGYTWPIADDLFNATGIQAYMEIDHAAGMDLEELRCKFPRLTLIGNVPVDALVRGEEKDIVRLTRECLKKGQNRGHILSSSNTIYPGVKTGNFLAMLDTLRTFEYER